MITEDGKLEIFEQFYVDRDLPKFRKQEETHAFNSVDQMMDPQSVPMQGGDIRGGFVRNGTITGIRGNNVVNFRMEDRQVVDALKWLSDNNPTLRNRIRYFFAKRFIFTKHGRGKGKVVAVHIDYENIEQFFSNMHLTMNDLDLKDKDVAFYEKLIQNARTLGQEALVEKLMSERGVVLAELSMIKDHKVKYITEDEVIEYYKKAKYSKNLYMTWIRNFARVIPQDAVELKKYCDEKGWFDNYVVLHFDRDGKSAEMTKEEKRRAKDPILFGLIENSRKLYFVADWTDDYCDLTLDKMLKVIGKDVLELNRDSLKNRIEKITA